ncbi:MAG: hypothetical protein FWD76_06055 [Firmicutes bacterium]|nr:hypothetical protein [Bacillota bacterium]
MRWFFGGLRMHGVTESKVLCIMIGLYHGGTVTVYEASGGKKREVKWEN